MALPLAEQRAKREACMCLVAETEHMQVVRPDEDPLSAVVQGPQTTRPIMAMSRA